MSFEFVSTVGYRLEDIDLWDVAVDFEGLQRRFLLFLMNVAVHVDIKVYLLGIKMISLIFNILREWDRKRIKLLVPSVHWNEMNESGISL